MSATKIEIVEAIATQLVSYGYTVYLAKSREYGFYTDGESVVSFGSPYNFFVNFSGNYKSKNSGSGWQIAAEQSEITAEEAAQYINAYPPFWATKGEAVTLKTPEQHLATYGKSSGYEVFAPAN